MGVISILFLLYVHVCTLIVSLLILLRSLFVLFFLSSSIVYEVSLYPLQVKEVIVLVVIFVVF